MEPKALFGLADFGAGLTHRSLCSKGSDWACAIGRPSHTGSRTTVSAFSCCYSTVCSRLPLWIPAVPSAALMALRPDLKLNDIEHIFRPRRHQDMAWRTFTGTRKRRCKQPGAPPTDTCLRNRWTEAGLAGGFLLREARRGEVPTGHGPPRQDHMTVSAGGTARLTRVQSRLPLDSFEVAFGVTYHSFRSPAQCLLPQPVPVSAVCFDVRAPTVPPS